MPIHNVGYRSWSGRRVPGTARWLVIALTGIRRAAKSRWLRRMLFLAILPPLVFAIPFVLFEQAMRDPQAARAFFGVMNELPESPLLDVTFESVLRDTSPEQVDQLRYRIWSYFLLTLFRYPQAIVMVLVVGIVAPPLISHDVRSRAFLIYFSRPISRLEYVAGKMGTVTFFLIMITTLPSLLLYGLAVLLSPSVSIVFATWDLPLRVLLSSVVLILPTTAVAIMFSSMTTESRYAGFAWFSIWILGDVVYSVLMAFSVGAVDDVSFDQPGWRTLLSPYHTLGAIQSWIFDLSADEATVLPAIALWTLVTVGSIGVILRRISLPMRA